MPTLKEYNVKLARLRSTSKMTRTMKMVAANKLRRAQEAERTAAAFRARIGQALTRLAGTCGGLAEHPLAAPHKRVGSIHLLLISSDRGLCGGFNNALNRRVAAWVDERTALGQQVRMSFFGRRGHLFFRQRTKAQAVYEGLSAKPSFDVVWRVARQVARGFLGGDSDEVYVAGNRPRGALSQEVVIERLLPVRLPAEGAAAPAADGGRTGLVDPSAPALADLLLERWVSLNLFVALTASAVAEHGARMTAMENSSANAASLIERTTLLRNRARQASVTRELLEIIAGAEALG